MRNIVWQFRTSFVVTLLSAATFLIFALLANGLTPYYQIFSQQQPLSSSHLHSNLDRHFSWNDQTAQGGSERDETYDLDVVNLDSNLDNIVQNIEEHGDYMKDLKNQLANSQIRSRLLPSVSPVNAHYNTSSYGWRIDPFSGKVGFHEGIDFPAPKGTPIVASASGMVLAAGTHAQYGNYVDIDHGYGIVTRYAHTSRNFVRAGEFVEKGQHIADVGSTGRSTGAHLHFEVRKDGLPKDPRPFLAEAVTSPSVAVAPLGTQILAANPVQSLHK